MSISQRIKKTILLTGASGNVGAYLRPLLRKKYSKIILSGRNEISDLQEGEEFRAAALDQYSQVSNTMAGVNAIVHLGGQPVEADWNTIVDANVHGAYNIFEGARQNGIDRVVFASTHHTVGMYGRNRKVSVGDRARPDTRYGVSKVLGEALAAYYADKFAVKSLSIRIGNVDTVPRDYRRLSVWLHPEDLMQLIELGINAPQIHSQVVFGVSDNKRGFWNNDEAHKLGYAPKHRSEDHIAIAKAGEAEAMDPGLVAQSLQGATFAAQEFTGELDDVLNAE